MYMINKYINTDNSDIALQTCFFLLDLVVKKSQNYCSSLRLDIESVQSYTLGWLKLVSQI